MELIEFAERHGDVFETVVVGLGMVVRKERRVHEWVPGSGWLAIRVDELAGAMVDSAVRRGGGTRMLENAEVRSMGKAVLKRGD